MTTLNTGQSAFLGATSERRILVPLSRPDQTPILTDAPLTLRDGSERQRASTARLNGLPEGGAAVGAFRTAPLLRLCGKSGSRLLVTGQWRFSISGETFAVEARINGVWNEAPDGWSYDDELTSDGVAAALSSGCFFEQHHASTDDSQFLIAVVAKASAEASRSAVADLRRLRYQLENDLAAKIRNQESDSTTLASLVALRTAVGKARDEAMTAVRKNLSMHHDDPEAYHRYRLAMDPTLLVDYRPADVSTRPWMRTHDAGMRQCRAMDEQLWDEAASLAQLLDASTTVYAARDAAAQEAFNTLGAFAAVCIGIPSLVLAYYGADRILPMTWARLIPLVWIILPIVLMLAFFKSAVGYRLTPSTRKFVLVLSFGVSTLLVLVALTYQT